MAQQIRNLSGQQQMQQYTGVVNADGSESAVQTAAFPQVLFVTPVQQQQMVSGAVFTPVSPQAVSPQGAMQAMSPNSPQLSPVFSNQPHQSSPTSSTMRSDAPAFTSSQFSANVMDKQVSSQADASAAESANDAQANAEHTTEGPEAVVGDAEDKIFDQPEKIVPWEKIRVWKVVNIEPDDEPLLPVVSRAEPHPPDSTRLPPDDMVVKWLQNGDIVRQLGHSKKMRGYMVMPIRTQRTEEPEDINEEDPQQVEGWVTRRLADKYAEKYWFEELAGSVAAKKRQTSEGPPAQED